MTGKLPVFSAATLVFLSQVATSAEVGRDVVTVEAGKIPLQIDLSRPQSVNQIGPQRLSNAERGTRVLFITVKDCVRCEKELSRLRRPGGDFESMQSIGWRIGTGPNNHIQIVDRDEIPEIVQKLNAREYPTVACIVDGEIVRSFKDGCTTPLDSWTFGWLIKGINERPQSSIPEIARVETTGNYRLRGNHWTLEGDPNPAKQTVINHLRGPNHGHASVAYGAIENWSLEELKSLHDDLHEREGGTIGGSFAQGPYQPAAANRSLDSFSGNRKVLGR
jgi:hypothetical protein